MKKGEALAVATFIVATCLMLVVSTWTAWETHRQANYTKQQTQSVVYEKDNQNEPRKN